MKTILLIGNSSQKRIEMHENEPLKTSHSNPQPNLTLNLNLILALTATLCNDQALQFETPLKNLKNKIINLICSNLVHSPSNSRIQASIPSTYSPTNLYYIHTLSSTKTLVGVGAYSRVTAVVKLEFSSLKITKGWIVTASDLSVICGSCKAPRNINCD